MIPNKEQALELLKKYNSDPFHIKHGLIVSGYRIKISRN